MTLRKFIYLALSLAFLSAIASCSTTRRLEGDDVLYTGIKHFKVTPAVGDEVPDDVKSDLFEVVKIAPNNSFFSSPYYRIPFPLGLWVYNYWDNKSQKGIKHWLYERFVDEPVLISNVKPELRVEMLKNVLQNDGYFAGSASYQLLPYKSNSKKAKVSYHVVLDKPYLFNEIRFLAGQTELEQNIDSLARLNNYLKPGQRYCTDSLSAARIAITNELRNKGYFYFRPEYIEYLADTTLTRNAVALKLAMSQNAVPPALKKYHTRKVVTTVKNYRGRGIPDTIATNRGLVVKMMPMRLRNSLIPSCLRVREGKLFRVKDIDRTQLYLSRLGIFSGIDINTTPLDSLNGSDSIDVNISCTLDRPLEASFEVQATSKSNSYIGPGTVFGLTHKNIFGGGEQLSTQLTASYEWQTGKGSSRANNAAFNSYEFGARSTLSFPRLLAPNFIDRTRRFINWTRLSLSGDILNRPHFFKMVQFGTSFSWEWHANKYSSNEFTPFKLTYTKLLSTTEAFDSAMNENPAVALSFRNQFIPLVSYSYTFDKMLNANNGITWNFMVSEAGNIFAGIWEMTGSKRQKKLFGTPFSQFVKAQTQLVYTRRLTQGDHWLVSRALIGAAHAYGNSSQVPYSEQFYIGGANSIRAFAVRSIGPGSYHPASTVKNGYYDQTGTFKLELNTEYRFPLFGYLHGALFIDAGNIWLLKDDSARPGGQLQAKSFLKDIALGTGFGLRFDMQMIVVRGDLGIGIHAPYDTGKKGYYNMTSIKSSLAFHIAIGYPF